MADTPFLWPSHWHFLFSPASLLGQQALSAAG
jgi:hypothetical protein